MTKKINSFSDLAKLKFDSLAPDPEETSSSSSELLMDKQFLEAHYSYKGRAGKVVTLIKGFQGSSQDLKALAKTLKNAVGVGGTVKNGEIIIQGNFRDKVMNLLQEMGHDVKRVGG